MGTATGLAATMPGGAASMNAQANVNPTGIMVGTSAVTTNHICMNWITAMATCRDTEFIMVILDRFARSNLFVSTVLICSTRSEPLSQYSGGYALTILIFSML